MEGKNNKIGLIALCGVVIILVVVGVVFFCKGDSTLVDLKSAEDIKMAIEKVNEDSKIEIPALETRILDLKKEEDNLAFPSYTGLTNDKDVETVVVSESMTGSTPYSLVMVKVKNGSDVEKIKKEMVDGIDMRKWICVGAEEVYATNSGDVIFMVMASKEDAKKQFDTFKNVVGGKFGKDLTREAEEIEFDFDETVPGIEYITSDDVGLDEDSTEDWSEIRIQ